jgi:hypothetical protein
MKIRIMILLLVMSMITFSSLASAGVPEVQADDRFSVDTEEEFDLVIFVDCHADVANYTVIVTLHPRFAFAEDPGEMVVTNDSASITLLGYDTDSLRFEFPMYAVNETPEGDYNIPYEVKWNGSETSFALESVEEGTVRVSVGEGGSEGACGTSSLLVLPFVGFGAGMVLDKKRKRRCS